LHYKLLKTNSDEDEYSLIKARLAFILLKESILNRLVLLWHYNKCKLFLVLLFISLLTLLAYQFIYFSSMWLKF